MLSSSTTSCYVVHIDNILEFKFPEAMAEEFLSDPAETAATDKTNTPTQPEREPVTIMVIGSRWAVRLIIHTLFSLGFAQVSEWSKLQVEPRTRRFMSVLTKYVRAE